MDTLGKRPNVLFLIAIRSQKLYKKLLITKLCRDTYYTKLNLALTVRRFEIISHVWRLNGKVHRINGPAVIQTKGYDKECGVECYKKNGDSLQMIAYNTIRHGVLNPQKYYLWIFIEHVLEVTSKTWDLYKPNMFYYVHGKLGRKDGPAIIKNITAENPKGDRHWYRKGQYHRKEGPAIIKNITADNPKGDRHWYRKGNLHRKDGPAIVKKITAENPKGNRYWCCAGQYHRKDGPAIIKNITADNLMGKRYWYRKGILHRKDGPAIIKNITAENPKGDRYWYRQAYVYKSIILENGKEITTKTK
jgi:hypothetical protein